MLISLDYLIKKYRLTPKYVLHIGASTGQEAEAYKAAGVHHVTWVEADPNVYNKLLKHISKYPGHIAVNACISDVDGEEIEFKITNNEGQSSSIFELGTHSQAHPSVVVVDRIKLLTSRIDTLQRKEGKIQSANSFDFLNIDLQCAELLALKGMGDVLSEIKFAYLEVNQKPLYVGCPMVQEIDMYMLGFGFKRVETKWEGRFGWGDAAYIRK